MFGRVFFEVIEVKGGRMVKERDFEAEKMKSFFLKIKYPSLSIYLLELGQNQQSPLKNQKTSTTGT